MTAREAQIARLKKAYLANHIPVTPDVDRALEVLETARIERLADHWERRAGLKPADDVPDLLSPRTPTKAVLAYIRRLSGFRYRGGSASNRIAAAENQWHGQRFGGIKD